MASAPTDSAPPSPPDSSTPPPSETSPPTPDQSPPPPPDSSPPPPDNSVPPPSPPPPPPPSPNDGTTPPAPPADNGNSNTSPPPPPPPVKAPSYGSPPPPRLAPPSQVTSSPGSKPSPSNDSVSIPLSTVILVAAGVGALFLLTMLIIALCRRKKKKPKQFDDQMPYYRDAQQGGAGYYNRTSHAGGQNIWQDSPQREHGINILPPPPGAIGRGTPGGGGWQPTSPTGAIGTTPAHGGWQPAPVPSPVAPPLPLSSSNDMSSSNFSGPYGPALPPPHPSVALGFNQCSFSYEELAAATQGFTNSNLLGQGGFGYVHKGVLPNGKEIAVKSLKSGSGQGDKEFQAEVEIISRVHHRHLVALVGFCIAGDRKLLVYEFIPNKTLEFHLHDKGHSTMDWATRLKIALGAAKGLAYLHEDCHPRIIHRDIKSANILIDNSFEAKVADFGLAKLTQDNNTHVSTRVMGTFGYLAPEYASSGKLTEKSDVFSFGVVLLELITGRRPLDMSGDMDESLVDWARPLCSRAIEQGIYDQLADPFLEKNYVPHEMTRMVQCAAAAIRHSGRKRPKMRQIVRVLEDNVSLDEINDDVRTEQSSSFSLTAGGNADDDEVTSYGADMKKFRKVAVNSNDYASSEFGHTSEYGLNPSSSSSEASGGATSRQLSP
ncbi:hypothetical protein SLE2022_201460 [Rubroshorea leprosula]